MESSRKPSPRMLDKALRESAEKWWVIAQLFRFSVFLLGAISIVFSLLSNLAPFIILILTGFSEWCRLKSDQVRDKWEGIHRELDAEDSFGWPLSKAGLSDLLAECPREAKEIVPPEKAQEDFFASTQPPGPARAAENMQESAWWAKHIAKRAATVCSAVTFALISLSIVAVLVSVEKVRDLDILSNIGRIAAATIMLVFSLDLVNLSLDYFKYHGKTRDIEERAEDLLSAKEVDEKQAIKLMNDYHLAHAIAPIIPSWIYRRMRDDLNFAWKELRRRDYARAEVTNHAA